MNPLKPNSIEEWIISLLQKKPLSGAELLNEIIKHRGPTTKQALYAVLRKLRADEIVVMHNMRISLSSVWVIKMTEFFNTAKHFYAKSATIDEGFLNLEDGDRVSYSFKSPNLTDIFWGHAFDILSEITPTTEPIYIYNPHEWFFLARYETEKTLFEKVKNNSRQILLVAGDVTPLDKSISKEFDGTITQYYPTNEKLFEKRNYYINMFGDFIIEVLLDEDISKKIDEFYRTTTIIDETTRETLKKIISQEGKNVFTISRNAKKAMKLKKMLGKYFYIKQ